MLYWVSHVMTLTFVSDWLSCLCSPQNRFSNIWWRRNIWGGGFSSLTWLMQSLITGHLIARALCRYEPQISTYVKLPCLQNDALYTFYLNWDTLFHIPRPTVSSIITEASDKRLLARPANLVNSFINTTSLPLLLATPRSSSLWDSTLSWQLFRSF